MAHTLTKPTQNTNSRPEKGQESINQNMTDVQLSYSWAYVNGSKKLLNVNIHIDYEGDVWMGSSMQPGETLPQNTSKFILRMKAFSNALNSLSVLNKRNLSRKDRLILSIFFLENVLKNSKLKNVLSKNMSRLEVYNQFENKSTK